MKRIPLGVSQLDRIVGGGAPRGSLVLVAGESGAGAREFCYTSAVMNALESADESLFDLYYGEPSARSVFPENVHYVSFTTEREATFQEMQYVMDDDAVEAAADAIEYMDLSQQYFQLTQVPTEWYADRAVGIEDLGGSNDRRDVLDTLGTYLDVNAPNSLVVIDSLSDLIGSGGKNREWYDLAMVLKGLNRALHRWGGVVLVHVNVEPLSTTEFGRLKEAVDGTIRCEWETGGSERARTMVVEHFRGVLSRLEDENIIRFETEIHDGGIDVSNVRKIR